VAIIIEKGEGRERGKKKGRKEKKKKRREGGVKLTIIKYIKK